MIRLPGEPQPVPASPARATNRSTEGLAARALRSAPLCDWTTLRVGGPADVLAFPTSIDEVQGLIRAARRERAPWRVLGRGSNLIVGDDGVPGYVVQLRELRHLSIAADGRVTAGAGLSTSRLLAATRARGLGGLQCLVGYPASVGGVARMNAGGAWGFAGERIESVLVVDAQGDARELSAAQCRFAYRSSALEPFVVVEVRFRLPAVAPRTYRREIDAIHREKASTQPLDLPSAGCIFRNPPDKSAGQLIDACGLKGRACGGAEVSRLHGNFIVNRGDARADDVLGLIEEIRTAVADRTGVRLALEVEVWRRAAP